MIIKRLFPCLMQKWQNEDKQVPGGCPYSRCVVTYVCVWVCVCPKAHLFVSVCACFLWPGSWNFLLWGSQRGSVTPTSPPKCSTLESSCGSSQCGTDRSCVVVMYVQPWMNRNVSVRSLSCSAWPLEPPWAGMMVRRWNPGLSCWDLVPTPIL